MATSVLALAIEVFALLSPLFLGLTVDHAIVSADRGLLVTLAAAFGLLLLMQVAVDGIPANEDVSTVVWQYRQSMPSSPAWCLCENCTGCRRATNARVL